jgi:hypothetical protein
MEWGHFWTEFAQLGIVARTITVVVLAALIACIEFLFCWSGR